MHDKFMHYPKIVLSTMILLLVATQFVGCKPMKIEPSDTTNATESASETTTETTAASTETSRAEAPVWTKLGDMTDIPEIRRVLNPYTKPDDTLFTAMADAAFCKALEDNCAALAGTLPYSDVNATNAYEAVLDAYFCLTGSSGTAFNGDSTLTRGQAMALVTRATRKPVEDTGSDMNRNQFCKAFQGQPDAALASYQEKYAYVQMYDGLDEAAYEAPMTKIEFVYLVVNAVPLSSDLPENVEFSSIRKESSSKAFGMDAIRNYTEDPASGVPAELFDTLLTAYACETEHTVLTTGTDYSADLSRKDAIAILAALARSQCPANAEGETTTTTVTETTAAIQTTTVQSTTALTTTQQTTIRQTTTRPATTPPPMPTTQPPVTQPPATQPPTTELPTTEPLTTQPPTAETQLPETQKPQTEAPATQPPADTTALDFEEIVIEGASAPVFS